MDSCTVLHLSQVTVTDKLEVDCQSVPPSFDALNGASIEDKVAGLLRLLVVIIDRHGDGTGKHALGDV